MKKPTLDILLKKFPASEYALMAEVRDAAGFGASRSADFLAMGLWPSRGLDMIGIERKSHRNDWLKELKTPEKAENIYQYCDRWYLLTDNENVAKIEEIPATWGWMHINKDGKLVLYKEAPKLNPVHISRSFLACVLKRAACKDGWIMLHTIEEQISAAKEAGIAERDYTNKRKLESHDDLVQQLKDFEEITGIKLHDARWGQSGKKLGEAVKFVMNGGLEEMERHVTQIKNLNIALSRSVESYEKLITES